MEHNNSSLFSLDEHTPGIAETAWIAPSAIVIGRVKIGALSGIWFNVTIRGDVDNITIGERSNIQDGSVVHVDAGFPMTMGNNITVGHNAILHGCTIEDEVLIGIGAIILNGATIRKGAQVGAGAVVPPGMDVPAGTLVMGIPAKVKRELTPEELQSNWRNADHYVKYAERYRKGLKGIK